jgi:hypothetical protein
MPCARPRHVEPAGAGVALAVALAAAACGGAAPARGGGSAGGAGSGGPVGSAPGGAGLAPAGASLAGSAPAAPITCAEAGVILRGDIEDPQLAGPAKEAIIARTCHYDAWPPQVLRCIGAEAPAWRCLEALTGAQRESHRAALGAWRDAFPDEQLLPSELLGDELDPPAAVDCTAAIHGVEHFAPAVALTGDARAEVVSRRQRAVEALCETWPDELRGCFLQANRTMIAACRGELPAAAERELAEALAEVDRFGARLVALQRAPRAVDCQRAAAAHYAEATWGAVLAAASAAARARLIAAAVQRMAAACTAERWSPARRTCLGAGGGRDCIAGEAAALWGHPPSGLVLPSRVAECNRLSSAIARVAACGRVPQEVRARLERRHRMVAHDWAVEAQPPERLRATCGELVEVARRALGEAGCSP